MMWQIFSFLSTNFPQTTLPEIQRVHVRAYVVHLVESKRTPATVRRHLSALKTYFRFCQKHGWITVNPALRIVTPKLPARLPRFVEQTQISTLLGTEEIFPEGWQGIRDRLVMEMLYGTGMRRNELLQLKWEDIDDSRQTIKVSGKGNKQRLVPATPALLQLLKTYKEETYRRFSPLADSSIILTDRGATAYDNFIYRIVKKYLSLCSTQKARSPHVLRHSFATHLSNNGAKLNDVKELLGHASLASTQVYTHNSIEQLKEVYKSAHPKA